MAKIPGKHQDAIDQIRRELTAVELELLEANPDIQAIKKGIRSIRSIAYFNFLAARSL